MDKMDDLFKNLNALKESLILLQKNTDELLRNAPREEVKKTFKTMSMEELEASIEYFSRHENYEVCQAIREVIEEKKHTDN